MSAARRRRPRRRQRQLGVGYDKAAKLVGRMEKEGLVGLPSGKASGRREVLVPAL